MTNLEPHETYAQLEQALSTAEEKLERANDDLERMAYVVSHDLQEPFRTIAGYAELIEMKFAPLLGPGGSEMIAELVKACGRQQKRLDALLAYSRAAVRKLGGESVFATFELEHALGEALDIMRPRLNEADARVEVAELPAAFGSETLIANVFQNLLANSVKYRRTNAPLRIQVWADQDEGPPRCVVVHYADTGMGFRQDEAGKIFRLFERLQPAHQFPGTGVGLAICRRIIEEHGGCIWAEGEPGKGAAFHFKLPAPPPVTGA
jgi:light-regulated signal transduction histidine kinase (bacteriophytochrome)